MARTPMMVQRSVVGFVIIANPFERAAVSGELLSFQWWNFNAKPHY
jgi:hypothetical protein